MGMHEGKARLSKSMKELLMRWNETKSHWRDSSAHAFESRFLTPMDQDSKQAVSAMEQMAQILQQAKRDCE